MALLGYPAASMANGRLWDLLSKQGFTSPLDAGTSIQKLGRIYAGGHAYEIYYYNHINTHPSGDPHGTQELVILIDKHRYIGSYLIDDKPIGISGRAVIFSAPASTGNRIPFTKRGPPSRVTIDGSPLELSK
jgi:hypothetical protein